MTMPPDRVLELVKKTQSGDEAAFAELYDEFAQRIYSYIRIKVQNQQTAEDILQEVFLKTWQGCKSLDLTNLNFSAWLYKVTSNTMNDYYRKKYRQPQTTGLEEAAEIAAIQTSFRDPLDRQIIDLHLDQLPPHYKEVIELRYMQDFSVADTARIMNKNSITIRVWQHRAIKQLEQLFKDYER